ncbi:MAG: hypothetical protein FDZ70_04400 [Actinobacteria bacterium]|nr:MAG: hypothetical protein FDZ70_04400 [Actinomycetota bacterium]
MSHIHVPDGVLPLWLWGGGWLLALALVWLAGRGAKAADVRRRVPLLGVASALMLVAMTAEIVPLAYHVNLTVVAGILLGPVLGAVAAFIVEVVLAMLGHGGVTVLGLNTIVAAAEIALGWTLFRGGIRMLGRGRAGLAAGIATVVTLAVTTTMLVGIVALAGGDAATSRETGALDPSSLTFRAPFADGVVTLGLFSGGEEPDGAETGAGGGLSVGRFAAVVYALGPAGWLMEALIAAAIVGYVARVRPALVFGGALAEDRRRPHGDAQGRH